LKYGFSELLDHRLEPARQPGGLAHVFYDDIDPPVVRQTVNCLSNALFVVVNHLARAERPRPIEVGRRFRPRAR
jgi:hypothetical protein